MNARRYPRAAAVCLVLLAVALGLFLLGHTTTNPSGSPASTGGSGTTASTDPHTGRTAGTLDPYQQLRADYVPTTTANATPEERTEVDIETVVRGFIRGWTLQAGVAERRDALEPYVSTPGMLDAFALSDPNEVPHVGLGAPPKVHLGKGDAASVFVIFADSTSITVHVVPIAPGWRVYQVDGG